jgi:polyisoprenoid-binding protein YceI
VTAQVQGLAMTAGGWACSDSRTQVTFSVGHLGHQVQGTVGLRWGEVEIGSTGAPVRVRAELDLRTLHTGVARRDADLRKPRFLDVDRYPTMTWTADRFDRADDGRWTADGLLGVRGTTTPLAVVGTPEPGPAGEGWVRVCGTAVLDRSAVGIRAPSFLVGRTVRITVDAWLRPAGLRS